MESKSESKVNWFSSFKIRLRELKNYIKNVFKIDCIDQDNLPNNSMCIRN